MLFHAFAIEKLCFALFSEYISVPGILTLKARYPLVCITQPTMQLRFNAAIRFPCQIYSYIFYSNPMYFTSTCISFQIILLSHASTIKQYYLQIPPNIVTYKYWLEICAPMQG